MSDPTETSENIQTAAHSAGEPDPQTGGPAGGSDVGGPDQTLGGAVEDAVGDTSTVSHDDDPDDQAVNPL